MHLSTSNSNIDYREIPSHPWGALLTGAVVAFVIAILGWEILARKMQHSPGTYKDGFDVMWAEERQKLDQPDHTIDVVLLGSSRMLWAADLDILQQKLPSRPLQLSMPGTSPIIFMEEIVNNTDFNGLFIVGVTPGLFNYLKPTGFSRRALNSYENQSPSQWLGTRVFRWLSDYFAFLDHGFSLFELTDHYIVLPKREGAFEPQEQGWKLGNIYQDRQTDMWAPVEIEGSFDNRQNTMFWESMFDLPIIKGKVAEGMRQATIDYLQPIVEKHRAKGGDIILVMMPESGPILERYMQGEYEQQVWLPMLKALSLVGVNSMHYPELSSELEIPEWSHFSRASQDLWSERIVDYLNAAYQKQHGRDLLDVIRLKGERKPIPAKGE